MLCAAWPLLSLHWSWDRLGSLFGSYERLSSGWIFFVVWSAFTYLASCLGAARTRALALGAVASGVVIAGYGLLQVFGFGYYEGLAGGKTLFAYSATKGDVVVTFNYDHRQQVTDTLHTLKTTISGTDMAYQDLKSKVDTLKATFEADKAAFNTKQAALAAKQAAYNAEVADWNRKGGASKSVYAALQQEGKNIQSQYAELQQDANNLTIEGQNLNALIVQLNSKVSDHNATAAVYNNTAASTASEFREGEYVEQGAKREIRIYQFEDATKLVRVLEHEFGHALGLEHVSDPKAIMYSLNDGAGSLLTEADKEELMRVCKK
jgi:hypothetical protein